MRKYFIKPDPPNNFIKLNSPNPKRWGVRYFRDAPEF